MTAPIKPSTPPPETPRQFAGWLAALCITVLGAKLWVIQLFASPLPLWDQWYEAGSFFKPWVDGQLKLSDFFASDNGHRIFVTRLLDFIVIGLNGRWEPMQQMVANGLIHVVFVCGLALSLWHFFGRRNGGLICFLLVPFFALPYAGENIIWAISLEYNLDLFLLLAVVAAGFGRPGGVWWWLGLVAAIIGLFTMATGLLAPMAIGGLAVFRALKQRRVEKGNLFTFIACVAITGFGVSLRGAAVGGDRLQAQGAGQFALAFWRNLTWLCYDHPVVGFLVLTPLILLAVLYFRRDFPDPRAAEFLLVLGLWGLLQAAALAYGRGNYGDVFPISRYLDIQNIIVIASLFAVLLLARCWPGGVVFQKAELLLPLAAAAVIIFCLARISAVVVDQLLLPTRMMNLVAEERVQNFMATDDEQMLFDAPTVRPDPKVTLGILHDPALRTILPASCQPPASAQVTGRFSFLTQWLLHHSVGILYGGLTLFIGLCIWQLIRSPLGLALENMPTFIILIAMLGALGFVWTKSPIRRETVEHELQVQLVNYFTTQNKPARAAVHAQKAKALEAGVSP